MSKLTIAYARCSTNEQRQSPSHQFASIEKFAETNGLIIDRKYEEYASGYKTDIKEREKIQEIKKLAIEGKVSNLLIFEQSRLARNTRDAIDIIDDLTKCGVKIWSVKDNKCINQDQIDKLLYLFQSFFSEQSSRDTSARIKSQKQLAKQKGQWLGGKVPFGYKIIDKKLVIDKAEVIQSIFNVYIKEGTQATLKYLKGIGISKSETALHKILNNPLYKGFLYKGEVYDPTVAIVSEEIWNKAQEVKSCRNTWKDRTTKYTNKSEAIYEGLLYHSCGHKLYVDWDCRYDTKRVFYRCRRCKNDSGQKSWSGRKLEPVLDEAIEQLFIELDRDKLREIYNSKQNKDLNMLKNRYDDCVRTKANKEKSLKGANESLELLFAQDVDTSVITNVSNVITNLKQELEKLDEEIKHLKEEIELEDKKNKTNEILIEKFVHMKDLYKLANNQQKKIILQQLIDKIIISDIDNIEIIINFL